MKKRLLLYLWSLSIPLLFFVQVWQANRYERIVREVNILVKRQQELIDENKRYVAAIAVLSATERIERIAREDLGLEKKRAADIIQLSIARGRNHDS
ncbi:MAG: septum formation initiator family protein [Treponemataceae bacterium]|uniref:septum formation initiator family protein n=1 Tax=Treponema sp. J25 TaxID=2094121 RepID=UPI00104427FA|nr:septum formation initiator family protein [Treponema sp. J25]MCX7948628.1 septum formation initiator family protein [Treponemataceae bacterium]HOJ98288.1 septum formation initiator family protein [Termitinemataceae bacterium]TCW62604.1 cell division protein FtsL [Treponema sp. J25]HOM22652.1 septum formation initiator family protein [Termitinemataceae bacterium]HPP99491.1 septum formation initiator family protein [Termitinemataceae bacterium]